MKCDVLFIHPGDQKKTYQKLANEFTALATPVWTGLLADSTRRQGHAVGVYDAQVEGWDEQVARDLVSRHAPRLVVIMVYGHTPSSSTQTMPAAGRIAQQLKTVNADLPIAMGGIHPSALPERTLREEKIDFVIQGEGGQTIPLLVDYLQGRSQISAVPGLWYFEKETIAHTASAPIAKNLDQELGFYAWDLLPDFTRYRAHNMHCFQDFEASVTPDFSDVRSPYVTLNTSLGCPYNCHYCCINSVFGKPGIRYWSEQRVVEWLDVLAKRGVRHIRFDDELFILSPERVERLCDMIIATGYKFNFWVYGRVDTIRESLLPKLKQAGFNWICLGIESANDAVRRNVNKKIRSDVHTIVKQIQAHDIYVHGNFMFGLPEDTRETMEETLQLAVDLNCEFINFYSVMPLPGSQLYGQACSAGTTPPTWGAFSQFSFDTQPLPTHHLPAREVLAFRDEAFLRYCENPKYLQFLERRFGSKVLGHVERMLTIKLERRLTQPAQPIGKGAE